MLAGDWKRQPRPANPAPQNSRVVADLHTGSVRLPREVTI